MTKKQEIPIYSHQMKAFKLFMLLISILSIAGCDNEIDINTDWKETPVVYAFLDPNTSTQYLRIQKTYQNSVDISTDQGAQINDSLYFDTILVKIKSAGLPDVLFTKTTEIPKEAGFFSSNTHYLYKANLTPIYNRGYTLEIYSPKTNNTYVSNTKVIGTSKIISATFQFTKPEQFITLVLTPIPSATTVSANLRFRYLEYSGSISSADTISVDYLITEQVQTTTEGNIRYRINNRVYVNYLKSIIPVKAGYTRQIVGFDMAYVGAGKELSDLMEIMKPSAAIVQKKLEYSNISGGLGIFSSRSENLDYNIQTLSNSWASEKPSLITLLNAPPANLNFIP